MALQKTNSIFSNLIQSLVEIFKYYELIVNISYKYKNIGFSTLKKDKDKKYY
jgi:hypothetical protein